MRKKTGLARLICVFFVCLLLLGYNFYGRFLKFSDINTEDAVSFDIEDRIGVG